MRRSTTVAIALAFWIGTPSHAGEPSRATDGQARAAASFEDFARAFMSRIRSQEERGRRQPKVAAGPGSAVFTYRGYGDEFRTELRPTGEASAPFVGLLHYTELVYSCRDLEGGACTVADRVPVTEVFRYRGGRWIY